MAMEIYWGSGSPYAWRALLALEIKKVPYTSRLLEFSKGQHKTPEYLALNPRGKVPALRNGKVVLAESLAILAYLDREFPQPPLFGRTAEQAGLIWKSIFESMNYLEPVANRVIAPLFFNEAAEKADDIRAAAKDVHAELAGMERRLAAQDWLATDGLSAADIAVYPWIELLLRAAGKEAAGPLNLGLLPLAKTYPAIAAWCDRVRAVPGYDKTYPPHWRN
ncbi:MAG: glutathione S-transferase family protein [Proteobacteria bacterium]|nr:glutathione S-transferase family protein [Pseudomonadota bacterium]